MSVTCLPHVSHISVKYLLTKFQPHQSRAYIVFIYSKSQISNIHNQIFDIQRQIFDYPNMFKYSPYTEPHVSHIWASAKSQPNLGNISAASQPLIKTESCSVYYRITLYRYALNLRVSFSLTSDRRLCLSFWVNDYAYRGMLEGIISGNINTGNIVRNKKGFFRVKLWPILSSRKLKVVGRG